MENRTDIYTPEQIAENYKVGRRTIYLLLRANKLKGFKVGRQWRVRKEDWLEYTGQLEPTK